MTATGSHLPLAGPGASRRIADAVRAKASFPSEAS